MYLYIYISGHKPELQGHIGHRLEILGWIL